MSFTFSIKTGVKSPFSPRDARIIAQSQPLSPPPVPANTPAPNNLFGLPTTITFPLAPDVDLPPLQGLSNDRSGMLERDPNCLGLRNVIWGCLCDQLFLCQWRRQRRMREKQMMHKEVRERRRLMKKKGKGKGKRWMNEGEDGNMDGNEFNAGLFEI